MGSHPVAVVQYTYTHNTENDTKHTVHRTTQKVHRTTQKVHRTTQKVHRTTQKEVLSRIFGPTSDEVTVSGENYIVRNLLICTPHPILLG